MMVTDQETMPQAVTRWIRQFAEEGWSGSLTLHFNRGTLLSYEPKPNLKIDERSK